MLCFIVLFGFIRDHYLIKLTLYCISGLKLAIAITSHQQSVYGHHALRESRAVFLHLLSAYQGVTTAHESACLI